MNGYEHWLGRLCEVAHYLRKATGAWPTEILPPDNCPVRSIVVMDPIPEIRIEIHSPLLVSSVREHGIMIGEYHGAAPGVWAYRDPRGALHEFYPPRSKE